MWAPELSVVATSNNMQWQPCQSQWTQLKPSPIVMDAINAIILQRQSTHETSLSNAQPHQQTQQGCNEGAMSITTILIMHQQLLSQEHQSPRRKHNKHNHEPGGLLNGKPLADWANSWPRSPVTNVGLTTKQAKLNLQMTTKKQLWYVLRVMCMTIAGQATNQVTW